jgi:hypothetical protein
MRKKPFVPSELRAWSYSTVEIDEMLRSEEFRAHRKKLRAEGKERVGFLD